MNKIKITLCALAGLSAFVAGFSAAGFFHVMTTGEEIVCALISVLMACCSFILLRQGLKR